MKPLNDTHLYHKNESTKASALQKNNINYKINIIFVLCLWEICTMKKKLFSGFHIFIIATLFLLSCHSQSRKLYYPKPGSVVFSIQALQNHLLKTVASQEFVYMSNNSNRNESIEFCPVESTGSFGICKHTGPHVESAVIAIHPSQQGVLSANPRNFPEPDFIS